MFPSLSLFLVKSFNLEMFITLFRCSVFVNQLSGQVQQDGKMGCTNLTALSVPTIGTEHYVYMESSRKKIYVPCEKYGPNVHYTL